MKSLQSPKKRTLIAMSASSMALAACGSQGDNTATNATTNNLASNPEQTYGRLKSAELVTNLLACKADVLRWNKIAIDALGLDHTPPAAGENRVFGEQLGPGRSSRVMAMVSIAVYDAIAQVVGVYQSYVLTPIMPPSTDIGAAIAYAAHDVLVSLLPSQAAKFDAALSVDLARPTPTVAGAIAGTMRAAGVEAGQRSATSVLTMRRIDGAAHAEPTYNVDFFPLANPGTWSPDPISKGQRAMGARWAQVKPFLLNSASQFRLAPPPALGSPEYIASYNEVQTLGGDGVITPTTRTAEQTFAGIFWAYDGTPSLCAPPRLYNQITIQIANQQGTTTLDLARLLMLVNVSMADAGIAAWESKYYFQLWRPVTGLRYTASGADGSSTPNFTPLGAPASNLNGPNFTPPFPAYASGHATFGGALFQVLRKFYGRDDISFSFTSDEYNGITKDSSGAVRPLQPRTFANFSAAEEENGQSRVYLGIHWGFDKTAGIKQGRQIADWVVERVGLPAPG